VAGVGGVSAAAEFMAQISAMIDAKLATIGALNALPKPGTAAKPKPKPAGLVAQLMSAAGHASAHAEDADDKAQVSADAEADADADGDEGDDVDDPTPVSSKAKSNAVDLSKRIGAALWKEEIAPYQTALAYVRMNTFRDARNKHECESLSLALDEMVREKIPKSSLGFEILVRRLIGVRCAYEYKDWSYAESLAWKSSHAVQNRGLLRQLLKDRKIFVEAKKPPPPPTTTTTVGQSFRGGPRRGGRGAKFVSGRGGRTYGNTQKPSPAGSGTASN